MKMRMTKQPVELAAIQRAIDITIDAFKDATRAAKISKYQYEYELEAEITRGMRRRGADGHAFPPIIAGGLNGCTLHYIENNSKINRGETIVLDIGAQYAQYAADLTRTIVLETPTKRQQKVYTAVCDAADYARSLLKPGVIIRDYEKDVEHYVGEKLRELGLIKTIDSESVRRYFPHATSHYLGLDTHDTGDYSAPLEPGVVMTVEPGIYIPGEKIGVRIEDDILITEDGNNIMSGRLSRSLN
jgi:Xaa-Pro aminopeptidase